MLSTGGMQSIRTTVIFFLLGAVLILIIIPTPPVSSDPTDPPTPSDLSIRSAPSTVSISSTPPETVAETPLAPEVPVEALGESPESSGETLKAEINGMVLEIIKNNRGLLNGIENIYVSQQPIDFLADESSTCVPGNIFGAHAHGTIIVRDGGHDRNKNTLYHEVAHHLWDQLSDEQRQEWASLYHRTTTFVTSYAQKNPNENFAENVACYFTNMSDCSTTIMPEKRVFIEQTLQTIN